MTAPTPDTSEAWIDAILDAVVSDCKRSGWFQTVTSAEPVNPPGPGLRAAVWVQAGPDPIGEASGLNAGSARLALNVRVYGNATAQPVDEVDPRLTKSVSSLMRRWHDDYDFGLHPLVRNVDLFGAYGPGLSSRAGYVEIARQFYRVMTINLPIIVNDVFPIGGGQ